MSISLLSLVHTSNYARRARCARGAIGANTITWLDTPTVATGRDLSRRGVSPNLPESSWRCRRSRGVFASVPLRPGPIFFALILSAAPSSRHLHLPLGVTSTLAHSSHRLPPRRVGSLGPLSATIQGVDDSNRDDFWDDKSRRHITFQAPSTATERRLICIGLGLSAQGE